MVDKQSVIKDGSSLSGQGMGDSEGPVETDPRRGWRVWLTAETVAPARAACG